MIVYHLRTLTPLALTLTLACQDSTADSSENKNLKAVIDPDATRVETQIVTRQNTTLKIQLPGEIEGYRDAKVASAQGGLVEAVRVQEGDRVEAGASMASINRQVAEAQLQQAKAQLTLAEHNAKVAQKAGKSLSQTRRIQAETQLKSAEAAHRLAQIAANRSRLPAPFAGIVSQVGIEEGEVAAPGFPLIRLVDIDRVKVSLSISDRDIRFVQPNAKALVLIEGGSQRIEAVISRVSPTANMETRTFIAEIDLPNPKGHLLPGMMVTVRIQESTNKEEITIPQYALVTKLKDNGVFVVEKGRAVWRPLELGGFLEHDLIVKAGLEDGDELVTRGHRDINEGDRLLVVKSDAKTKKVARANEDLDSEP